MVVFVLSSLSNKREEEMVKSVCVCVRACWRGGGGLIRWVLKVHFRAGGEV